MFTRAVPTLTVVVVLELLGALDSEWAWWVNLGVAAASLAALLGVWALVNVLRTRSALGPAGTGGRDRAGLGLLVRALPLLLLFVTFLFLTAEVWQVAASLDGPFLAVTMTLFVAVGVVFVVARIPLEVGALARFDSWTDVAALVHDTPAAALQPPGGASPGATPRGGGSGAAWAWWCCSPRACRSCWSAR